MSVSRRYKNVPQHEHRTLGVVYVPLMITQAQLTCAMHACIHASRLAGSYLTNVHGSLTDHRVSMHWFITSRISLSDDWRDRRRQLSQMVVVGMHMVSLRIDSFSLQCEEYRTGCYVEKMPIDRCSMRRHGLDEC